MTPVRPRPNGAQAERFMAVPDDARIDYSSSGSWTFPNGTALGQTLAVNGRRMETRVLLRQQGEWAGYTYRWNDEQSDAVLVDKAGEAVAAAHGGDGGAIWKIPSRAECMTVPRPRGEFCAGSDRRAAQSRTRLRRRARQSTASARSHRSVLKRFDQTGG